MVVRVDVEPSLYKWALERSKLESKVLVRRFPMLREWMSGDRSPTLRQVEKFAQATGTAVGYFFLPKPPDEKIPIPDLSTPSDEVVARPSGNLLDAVYQCQQRQDWYREYARSTGLEKLEWVGSLRTSTPTVEAARKITQAFSFSVERRGANWAEAFTNLRNRADDAGVLVMVNGVVGSNNHRALDPQEFRGFALADAVAPLVFVNGADTRAAQIFTLAHELAHIWLGESALSDTDLSIRTSDRRESWCNKVAAEILVPKGQIRSEYDHQAEQAAELQRLARRFKSSTLVVLRQIHDAGYLSWEEYRRLYRNEYERAMAIRSSSGGGNFYNTQLSRVGRSFAQAVITSTLEGHTSYTDAFQMLGFKKLSAFYELADRLGVK